MTWTTIEGHEIKSLRTMITHDKLKVKKVRRDQGHHHGQGPFDRRRPNLADNRRPSQHREAYSDNEDFYSTSDDLDCV